MGQLQCIIHGESFLYKHIIAIYDDVLVFRSDFWKDHASAVVPLPKIKSVFYEDRFRKFNIGIMGGGSIETIVDRKDSNVAMWAREYLEKRIVQLIQSGSSSETDVVEEIKKYKELLDSGILTPEEFAAKKKQLLGI